MFLLILVYLGFVIVRPQDFLPGMAALPVMSVTLLLAFGGWLLRGARAPGAPQFLLLPVFVLIAMASEVASGWAGGIEYVVEQMGPSLIVFFVLASAIDGPRRTAAAFAVIGLCAMVLALHSVQQASHGVGWTGMTLGEDGRIRYVGIFNDPNDLGLLFVMALPMVLCLASRAGFLGRWFWRLGALLLLAGVYLTKSRGTQLAVLLMGAIWLWRTRGLMTAGALSFAGLVGLMLMPSTRMSDLDPDEESAFGRVDAWYEGLDMFKTHPLLGVGFGNFTDYNPLTAHNSFVLVLAETGFLGFMAWLAFVGYCFWMMWRLLRLQSGLAKAVQATVRAVARRSARSPASAGVPGAEVTSPGSRHARCRKRSDPAGDMSAQSMLSCGGPAKTRVSRTASTPYSASCSPRFTPLPSDLLILRPWLITTPWLSCAVNGSTKSTIPMSCRTLVKNRAYSRCSTACSTPPT